MIKATVGRKVWYRPSINDMAGQEGMRGAPGAPLDATIVAVHSDRMVNLAVFDGNATQFKRCSVTLLWDDDPIPEGGGYAQWMPYQTAQAQKEAA